MRVVPEGPKVVLTLQPKAGTRLTGPRMLVLGILEERGEIRDEDGGATAVLLEEMVERGHEVTAKSLANSLKAMDEKGLIEREVRGKRTYAIRLGPAARDHDRIVKGQHDEIEPVVELDELDGQTWGGLDDGQSDDMGRLAIALLNEVANVLAREGEEGRSVAEVRGRLGVVMDEAQRTARKLKEIEQKYDVVRDELAAARAERDAWKKRYGQAESNIQSIIKAGGRPLDDRKLTALQRFIAQTPSAKR